MATGRFQLGRVLVVVAVLAMVGFWSAIYAGAFDRTNPDRLEDRAWVDRAEATCQATRDRIDVLPPARASRSPDERAATLDQATDELDAMVAELAADRPAGDGDPALVRRWLEDWGSYLAARRRHADALREAGPGDRPQFVVPEKEGFGDGVDRVIEIFADDVNEMPACAVPLDVG